MRCSRIYTVRRQRSRDRLTFSRLSFPAGKTTSRCREVRACPQRALVNGRLPHSLRLRVAEEQFVGQLHLLPGTLLPQRNFSQWFGQPQRRNATTDFVSKRLRRFALQSRDQADHETLPPWLHCVLAFVVLVSHICLFTLSEGLHKNAASVRLRYPEGKRRWIFCQALFLKNRVFG